MKTSGSVIAIVAFVGLIVLLNALYTVQETEQVIITQFGRPIGDPITKAGLNIRIPFIQKVNRIEKRILEWDGRSNNMPTRDKLYIAVDTFGRWRITSPLTYFRRLRDERSAQSRLEDILGSETRNAVARHDLIEIIRTNKGREPLKDETLGEENIVVGELLPIVKGRIAVEDEIVEAAAEKLIDFGIELLDVRFKRINYNESVRKKIYDRMISERQQIASRFRSEGEGEAARILGDKERDVREIESRAYRAIEEIKGEADATATEIYAAAYNQSAESIALYGFLKTLETYREVVDEDTTLMLSTKSELFRLLKDIDAQ